MSLATLSKLCTKCKESKPLDAFQKNRVRKDGLENYCRECNNARFRHSYAKDPKKKIEKTRQYHVENFEWSKEYQRQWHITNRDRRYAKVKQRLLTDAEFRQYRRDMTKISSHKRRALIANTTVETISRSDLNNLLQQYDGKCWICGYTLTRVFWDHFHPISKGGPHSKSNLRPSCVNCNPRKGSLWPFTDDMKEQIAKEVRALRTPQEHTIPVKDGKEVYGACHT